MPFQRETGNKTTDDRQAPSLEGDGAVDGTGLAGDGRQVPDILLAAEKSLSAGAETRANSTEDPEDPGLSGDDPVPGDLNETIEDAPQKRKRRRSSLLDDVMILCAVAAFVTLALSFSTLSGYFDRERQAAMEQKAIVELNRLDQAFGAYQMGDFAAARRLWQVAAKDGDPDAQYNLGVIYAEGRGVVRNPDAAIRWWRMAASEGHARAQHNLGLALLGGEALTPGASVPSDQEGAEYWLRQSSKQDLPEANLALGQLLIVQDGDANAQEEAVHFFERAASDGLPEAQFALAKCYLEGRGVEQNKREALAYLLQSAKARFTPAQSQLGALYMAGDYVNKDLIEALAWSTLAGEEGLSSALERRHALIDAMSDEEVALANRRSVELAGQIDPS